MTSNGKEGMSKLKFAYDFLGTELHRIHGNTNYTENTDFLYSFFVKSV